MVVAFKIVRKYFFSRKTSAKVYGNFKKKKQNYLKNAIFRCLAGGGGGGGGGGGHCWN